MKKTLILTSLFLFGLGCDNTASHQRQAMEKLRKQKQQSEKLRQMGLEMHKERSGAIADPDGPGTPDGVGD